jgi:hypothetical protein
LDSTPVTLRQEVIRLSTGVATSPHSNGPKLFPKFPATFGHDLRRKGVKAAVAFPKRQQIDRATLEAMNKKRIYPRNWSFPIILAALVTGCRTTSIPAYQPGAVELGYSSQKDGLHLTVDPFLDEDRTQKYFLIKAYKEGLVICHVHIRNDDSAVSYHVRAQNFKLLLGNGGEVTEVATPASGRSEAGELMQLIGPGWYGMKQSSDASKARQNLAANRLLDETLSPGRSMQGFVYFKLPAKSTLGGGSKLTLSAENSSTHEKVEIVVPIVGVKTKQP